MTSKSATKNRSKKHHKHGDWSKQGKCVYCVCGTRLYTGTMPKNDQDKKDMSIFIRMAEKYAQGKFDEKIASKAEKKRK